MAGGSAEYEISLISGKTIVEYLDPNKYKIFPFVIPKNKNNFQALIGLIRTQKIDVCFIALHGPGGEDGTIQKKLDNLGIKYTGSGILASQLGMDKLKFKKKISKNGICLPKHVLFRKGDSVEKLLQKVDIPCIVKPSNQGSSIGVSLVMSKKEFKNAIDLALKYSNKVIVEEYIAGLETTVPILGNERPYTLPVVEILPKKGRFFDYKSKYKKGGSEEIVPARISRDLTKKVQEVALRVYKTIGCKGFARVDLILKGGLKPVVLEINTIPGLTPMSLFPKSAKAAGISYSELLDKIIEYALE